MAKRVRMKDDVPAIAGNVYQLPTLSGVKCVPTGCTVLDCVLGGGWGLGRIANIVGDRAVGKCARDYYLLTPEGLIYSEDLASQYPMGASETELILALDRERVVKATHFWKEEVSKTLKVKTRYGLELTATPDHKVQVMRPDGTLEMRRVEDISVGDWLVVSQGTNLFPKQEVSLSGFSTKRNPTKYASIQPPSTLNETLGAWLGALIADGTTSSGPLGVTAQKEWKRALLTAWSEELFPGSYSKTPTGFTYAAQAKDLVELVYGSSLKGSTARYKRVPTLILRSPKHVQAAFLRSLMSFDGYLTHGLSWSTASKRLAREVQMMLLNFGIFGLLTGRRNVNNGWKYYSVSVHGERFDAFEATIGLCKPSTKRGRSTKSHSDILSVPYGMTMIKEELLSIRKRFGWTRNGKFADGRRSPALKAFCRGTPSSSYVYLEECWDKLRGLSSSEFDLAVRTLLEKRFAFDKVIGVTQDNSKQVVTDVHVPDGHLFWGSGLINHNTLLAIEACANFAHNHPKGRIFYRESEAAFDASYAETLGLPLDRVDFGPDGAETQWETIEDVFEDLDARLYECEKEGVEALYIVDSLDALSSRAELSRKPGEGTFGLEKQKTLGELFRKLTRRINSTKCALIFISQIRDKIGITFGEKHTRSGGKALDFYASQILWLHHLKQLGSTRGGVKRVTGVRIKAKCKKNKISLPFRECEFEVAFGFGVRDELASIEWLEEVKALGKLGLTPATADAYLDKLDTLSVEDLKTEQARLRSAVLETWTEVEGRFTPKRKKYV